MFNEISAIMNLDSVESNKFYKSFAKKLPLEQEVIFSMKQKLYNSFSDDEDKKKLAELKKIRHTTKGQL